MCWEDGCLPQDLKDVSIVQLYTGKGDTPSCDNYRGISLLSIAGKILSKVILNRVNTHLLDKTVPESQCVFCQNRRTVDMIFTARQIQEKCKEQYRDLHILSVNLTKACDTVSRLGLWNILPRIGIPPKTVKMISEGDEFPITKTVKQGCVLAPTVFSFLRWSIFNTQYLKAKMKVTKSLVRDLLSANDYAIVDHLEDDRKRLADSLLAATKHFGLTIRRLNGCFNLQRGQEKTCLK